LVLKGARSSLVIIGGSGDVARHLLKLLPPNHTRNIYLISRGGAIPAEASQLSVTPVSADITDAGFSPELPEEAIVINLTEATPPQWIASMIARGHTVLDTSASPEYVSGLKTASKDGGGLLVLCVGTAPGLSTLMAADVDNHPETEIVEIALELGMGRHYGRAATEWFFKALGNPYRDNPTGKLVAPGTRSARVRFAPSEAPRQAIDIGFPDQRVTNANQRQSPITRLAIDPPFMTLMISILIQLGLGSILSRRARFFARVSHYLPNLGRMRTRIAVTAFGAERKPIFARYFEGGDQAALTAAMIIITLGAIQTKMVSRSGLTTIADHLDLDEALSELRIILPDMKICMRSKERHEESC